MKYLFCGNRINVLNQMLLMRLNVQVVPIYPNKDELIKDIIDRDFDIFVSNGCPYILPISKMKKQYQTFINIHPSFLPDLKGNSPIIGAIKYDRPFGATCHLMDDGIDTGLIIARTKFNADRNNLADCYKKSYKAEIKVFLKAYDRNFKPLVIQPTCKNPIYYSQKG